MTRAGLIPKTQLYRAIFMACSLEELGLAWLLLLTWRIVEVAFLAWSSFKFLPTSSCQTNLAVGGKGPVGTCSWRRVPDLVSLAFASSTCLRADTASWSAFSSCLFVFKKLEKSSWTILLFEMKLIVFRVTREYYNYIVSKNERQIHFGTINPKRYWIAFNSHQGI
jgi:hypothetical protein